ncbi:tyrosine-type recombinase/integrase [Kitasatospora azatica]|uniref:tyrosine-type recombinase/integrase n=1 Tax=Kitasatospora azatica TaxID=58347 RepID=UPI00055FBD18|nr:site-specific integrase [Kitasatospora azatica]
MAGHVQDRWYKTETDPDGKSRRVKTDRYGTGMRYRARYIGPDGAEQSKSFPDRKKREAENWLTQIEADMARGQYIDPKAARTTFQEYAARWLASQTTDAVTQEGTERRLRLHVLPYLGNRPMGTFQPAHIREWLKRLEASGLAASYIGIIYTVVRAVLSAGVDDGFLPRNPCASRSVRQPSFRRERVVPWTPDRVFSVRAGLPQALRPMVDLGSGCGLRQGEIFGLAVDAIDFDAGILRVVSQTKVLRQGLVFAPPKGDKVRDVPLPAAIAAILKEHIAATPPVAVTLPWRTWDGPKVTKLLLFTDAAGCTFRRSTFNDSLWKPALAAGGVIPVPQQGQRYASAPRDGMHALRHFYASVLLDAGENIKALSEYLGHADAAITLRTYTHLMPSSPDRTRRAVDALYKGPADRSDGP